MSDHKRKKKEGRNKLNLRSCFRSSFTPDDNNFYNGKNVNGRFGKPVMVAVSSSKDNMVNPDVNIQSYPKRSPPGRRISRMVKAVLFNSLMVKKIANSSSKSSDQTSESSFLTKKIEKSNDDNICSGRDQCTDTDDSSSRYRSNLHSSSSSRTTSSSYSSSSSSSGNYNSRSSSDQKPSKIDLLNLRHPITFNSRAFLDEKVSSRTDHQPFRHQDSTVSLPLGKPKPINSIPRSLSFEKGLSRLDSVDSKHSVLFHPGKVNSNGNNYWNIRWCLFLFLSLIVLMVYGRIYSILCTSIWFYFIPCRKMKRVNSVTNAVKFFDTDSEQYKKRVIMAGLLDRTRNPLR
ncbi:uncharacterized protein [Rutidosis leptorrhynchoides]|uniref:uncharacterized protein n=1 Tax=Rutidosis leptorrhynchoides TaxID=125765 RepID=UPI003A98E220